MQLRNDEDAELDGGTVTVVEPPSSQLRRGHFHRHAFGQLATTYVQQDPQ